MRARNALGVSFALLLVVGCGPDRRNNCAGTCTALGWSKCAEGGGFEPPVQCGPDQVCDPEAGCVVCPPDELYCGGPTGDDVYRCNGDGTDGVLVEDCPPDQVCSDGACKTPCEAALDHPSNVGCDFWAADLDNEAVSILPGIDNDAAKQQFAVVIANNNDYAINVTVTKNAARVGAPVVEEVVVTRQIGPRLSQRVDLPQREVDGAMGQNGGYTANSGSGTFVSPHAFHIVTTGPVTVYQFQPIIQQFSNDASTLIPIQALGTDYISIGFQTSNPCFLGPAQPSLPDHGALTIIATQDDTHVTVTSPHAIMASGGDSGFAIPETPANGTVTFTLGRYTVVNLETRQAADFAQCLAGLMNGQDGDLTGTHIKSNKPVVVFNSQERGSGFGGATNISYHPRWTMDDKICCTEHMEEQLFPTTALGREFAVARSPVRSTHPTWVEQDIFRVVGTVDGTLVKTNLPPPYQQFTVNRRKQVTFMADRGFTLSADQAVEVGQYLVSQQFILDGWIGDPSMLTVPAAEQHRKDYVFLVPPTWTQNYAVFAKPVAAKLKVDGVPIESSEFGNCAKAPIGPVVGVDYEQITCLVATGRHRVEADLPFGLSVFGYHSVGAYSFVGGSDVKIINVIE